MMTPNHKLLILVGATAVGKTALAIDWAQRFGGEILNADSRQIYRHMDIGTAKPSPADQAAAPHHLLDLVDPDQTLSAAEFQQHAYAKIAEVHGRGALPILAGGTGQYITAVLEGWQIPAVPPDPALRAALEAMSNAALFAKLQALDPAHAEQIDRHNPRRLVRAVEVCLLTGRPFSEQRRKNPPAYATLAFWLDLPRAALYARADARVGAMLAAGWVEEVQRLGALGYDDSLPAMSALGYPQISALLRGEIRPEEAREQIQNQTHRFIRRQYTWFRKHNPGWHMLEDSADATPQIAAWLADLRYTRG